MNPPNDTKTLDLLPEHDLAGERPPKRKGGRQRVYADNAAKVAAYRKRKAQAQAEKGTVTVPIELPTDVNDQLDAWLKKMGKEKSAVIEKLIRTQLLRVR